MQKQHSRHRQAGRQDKREMQPMVGSVHSEMGMEEGFEPTKELVKGDHYCGRWERVGIKLPSMVRGRGMGGRLCFGLNHLVK